LCFSRDARGLGDIILSAGEGNDPRKCINVVIEGGNAGLLFALDSLFANFMGFVKLAAIAIWLK
jgi:hypothetical protein